MFSRDELKNLPDLCGNDYVVIRTNGHDVTIKSTRTGHDWILVSNYTNASCFLLHRHNSRVPFHRQRGRYKSCGDAMRYIKKHDEWVLAHRRKIYNELHPVPIPTKYMAQHRLRV